MSALSREAWWSLLALTAWLGAGLLLGVLLVAGVRGVPALPADGAAPRAEWVWPAPAVPAAQDWAVLQRVKAAGALTATARRFRLAGTYFAFESAAPADGNARQAVIEDLQKKTQYLLKEGETSGDLTLLRILADRVAIRVQEREEELRLSFADAGAEAAAAAGSTTNAEPAALETSRFGKRVGENRWVISREALLQYYEELRQDPERVVALFASLKPAYQGKAVTGYVLDMEGEREFFQAAGLRNGDVVRKVNSINMTSQARAEYLIREFLQNRVSALVFDVEREQQAQKLIYFIR
ncbi:MAG: hypothetical protein NTV49_15485 [Kiritimatiellaeota bacterium]|nr:hypothetical protein [Kiritimatiellota bacterium]